MNFNTCILFCLGIFSFSVILGACGNKEKEVEAPVPTIKKQKIVKKEPAPAPVRSNALAKWEVPKGDMELISEVQSAEGSESSIGLMGSQPIMAPNDAPSISISPTLPDVPEAKLDSQ